MQLPSRLSAFAGDPPLLAGLAGIQVVAPLATSYPEIRAGAARFERARRASIENVAEGERIARRFPTDRLGRVVCPEGYAAIDDYEQDSLQRATNELLDSWRYLKAEILRAGYWSCVVENQFYCCMDSGHTDKLDDGVGYPVFPARQILNLDA